jgi:hypothetical protein
MLKVFLTNFIVPFRKETYDLSAMAVKSLMNLELWCQRLQLEATV